MTDSGPEKLSGLSRALQLGSRCRSRMNPALPSQYKVLPPLPDLPLSPILWRPSLLFRAVPIVNPTWNTFIYCSGWFSGYCLASRRALPWRESCLVVRGAAAAFSNPPRLASDLEEVGRFCSRASERVCLRSHYAGIWRTPERSDQPCWVNPSLECL